VVDLPGKRHPKGLKRWMFRYKRPTNGRMNELGIGHVSKGVDLDKAKAAWMDCQFHLRRDQGRDPQDVRRVSRGQRVTWVECANKYIERYAPSKGESWLRNAKLALFKHGAELKNEAVATIDHNLIEQKIAPLVARAWPQGRRTLAVWEDFFNFARTKGWRTWENPARWKDLHKHNFPRPRHTEEKHHPGLPVVRMPTFMPELRQLQTRAVAAIQLEITILTLLRPNKEVRLIQWDEIDWDDRILSVPAWRMKNKKLHRVPLVDRPMELFRRLKEQSNGSPFVFTGYSQEALADRGMIMLLRNTMGISKDVADVHGFRSTFSNWAYVDKRNFEPIEIEMCLSHTPNKIVRAYLSDDLLDKRRKIMQAWSDYLNSGSADFAGRLVHLVPRQGRGTPA
jgi:integrase